ncbi:MAG: hypothetical protein ACXWGV_12235 [Solirubrobacterales bacterium]
MRSKTVILPGAERPSRKRSGFVQASEAPPRCNEVMTARPLTQAPDSLPASGQDLGRASSVLKLGAVVSFVQSALFVVIGVAALVLGVDGLVDDGFASLAVADPTAFRVLCGAFILIAVLGLAITGAERALIEPANAGLARYGAVLAYLGHAGTIAFFSWWLIRSFDDAAGGGMDLDVIAPIEWGVMFELVFVGAWVWIIAAAIRDDPRWPRGFLLLSVAKATSFWLAYLAILHQRVWSIALGVGIVTFVTGPGWHAWIAGILRRLAREEETT